MIENVAEVHVLDAPFHVDKAYDYAITPELVGKICVGGFVCVPFGGKNSRQLGLVTALKSDSDFEKIKPIHSIVFSEITLSAEQLGIVNYMKTHTFCTTGDAVSALLPPSVLSGMRDYYRLSDPSAELPVKANENVKKVLLYLKKHERCTESDLIKKFGSEVVELIKNYVEKGVLIRTTELVKSLKYKSILTVSLKISPEEALLEADRQRSVKQAALLRLLVDEGPKTISELKDLGFSKIQAESLETKGAVMIQMRDTFRDPYETAAFSGKNEESPLSEAQNRAKEEISSILNEGGGAKAVLLRGVTGSGKTKVIKAIMDEVIASGCGVIMLVPEIGLTPQAISVFKSYYKDRAVVLHSQLSVGERYDAWLKIAAGDADVCIGTRSAVFAPFRNLGLIVIDEEQEHTYKSDMNPKYHARDIARFRCAYHGAMMLLASATPSVESEYRSREGRYREVVLSERYGDAKLPEGIIADMREDTANGNLSAIGLKLRTELEKTLANGEQAILFVNRRGYHNFVSCPVCGNVIMCPHCSVSYTYHALRSYTGQTGGFLLCHYCGSRAPAPEKCPSCGNDKLRYYGYGTQKVEEELVNLFPDAKIIRMDADTTSAKYAYDNIIGAFRRGEYDILIGTQMVTKGHDFPNVTLVGVLNADYALYIDDYQAYERTFSLITQVVGRAGRSDKPGRALIQTFNPEHPVLKLAAKQDYTSFYESEIVLRRALVFPPCCELVEVSLSSTSEAELGTAAAAFGAMLNEMHSGEYSDVELIIFGPIDAPLYKINENFKKNFVIKCRLNARTRDFIRTLAIGFEKKYGRRISFSLDVNPSNL
ncbi:MAG: primosomal protein N' [Firmicutes bacterium]|nr:primosomal protein N' [Bacillota bacterium]